MFIFGHLLYNRQWTTTPILASNTEINSNQLLLPKIKKKDVEVNEVLKQAVRFCVAIVIFYFSEKKNQILCTYEKEGEINIVNIYVVIYFSFMDIPRNFSLNIDKPFCCKAIQRYTKMLFMQ